MWSVRGRQSVVKDKISAYTRKGHTRDKTNIGATRSTREQRQLCLAQQSFFVDKRPPHLSITGGCLHLDVQVLACIDESSRYLDQKGTIAIKHKMPTRTIIVLTYRHRDSAVVAARMACYT